MHNFFFIKQNPKDEFNSDALKKATADAQEQAKKLAADQEHLAKENATKEGVARQHTAAASTSQDKQSAIPPSMKPSPTLDSDNSNEAEDKVQKKVKNKTDDDNQDSKTRNEWLDLLNDLAPIASQTNTIASYDM